MPPTLLYCWKCGMCRRFETLPATVPCAACKVTDWITQEQLQEPRPPYELTHNDRRFLSSIHITADPRI